MCQNRTWTGIGSMCIPRHWLSFQVLTCYSVFNVHFTTVASLFLHVLPCFVTTLVSLCSIHMLDHTGPRSTVGNMSGNRCESDCRSRGWEFDPGPFPYFRGDWSWNNFYGHSPAFHWIIQGGLLSVTSESMCTNYWLTACSSLPGKKCG